jgi:hypothetical protein
MTQTYVAGHDLGPRRSMTRTFIKKNASPRKGMLRNLEYFFEPAANEKNANKQTPEMATSGLIASSPTRDTYLTMDWFIGAAVTIDNVGTTFTK